MARTTNKEASRIRSCVLNYIAYSEKEELAASRNLSHREMSRVLGISVNRVRYSCRLLIEEGLVIPHFCFDEYGGQRANSYTITQEGWQLVQREGSEKSQATPINS